MSGSASAPVRDSSASAGTASRADRLVPAGARLNQIEVKNLGPKSRGYEVGKPVSISAFARRKEVNESSVRKAIRSGRLERCLGSVNGRTAIVDIELADFEWLNNSDPSKDRS